MWGEKENSWFDEIICTEYGVWVTVSGLPYKLKRFGSVRLPEFT